MLSKRKIAIQTVTNKSQLPLKRSKKKLSNQLRVCLRKNRRSLKMKNLNALWKKWVSTLPNTKKARLKPNKLPNKSLPTVALNQLPRRRRKRRKLRRQMSQQVPRMSRLKCLLRWLKSRGKRPLKKQWKSAPRKMRSTALHPTWALPWLKLKHVPRTRRSDLNLHHRRENEWVYRCYYSNVWNTMHNLFKCCQFYSDSA